jgi:hypothetical protein
MMKTLKLFTILILVALSIDAAAQGQGSRFSFELNAGPSITLQELGDTDLKTGVGFEGLLHYRIMPHLGAYAGWGWNKFASDETFAGADVDFEETGYVFGLQFKHPINQSSLSWYVRGGGLYNHIEVENSDGDIIEDTGHGLGFHAGTGLDIQLSNKWSILPSVTFHSLSRDLDGDGINTTLDLTYLSGRIGILKSF